MFIQSVRIIDAASAIAMQVHIDARNTSKRRVFPIVYTVETLITDGLNQAFAFFCRKATIRPKLIAHHSKRLNEKSPGTAAPIKHPILMGASGLQVSKACHHLDH